MIYSFVADLIENGEHTLSDDTFRFSVFIFKPNESGMVKFDLLTNFGNYEILRFFADRKNITFIGFYI